MADKVRPSVVQVVSREGSGSGVKVAQGIITNEHVVGEASSVEVVDAAGHKTSARVLKIDPAIDLALLQDGDDLPPLAVVPSSQLRQGDTVLAFGFPRPDLLGANAEVTLTHGLISAFRPTDAGVTYIQTDAAINPGNSGGALVNLRAELVGIPSYGSSGDQGLNLAISGETVASFINAPPDPVIPNTRTFQGDVTDLELTLNDFGPDWNAVPADVASELGLDAAFVQGDVNNPDALTALVGVAADTLTDAQRAEKLMKIVGTQPQINGIKTVPSQNVADGCVAQTGPPTDGALTMTCRIDNVVFQVVEVGRSRNFSISDVAYYMAIMIQRERESFG